MGIEHPEPRVSSVDGVGESCKPRHVMTKNGRAQSSYDQGIAEPRVYCNEEVPAPSNDTALTGLALTSTSPVHASSAMHDPNRGAFGAWSAWVPEKVVCRRVFKFPSTLAAKTKADMGWFD
jgi:hypothetical protein